MGIFISTMEFYTCTMQYYKKTIPEAFANEIRVIWLYPGSLSIKEMITSKGRY